MNVEIGVLTGRLLKIAPLTLIVLAIFTATSVSAQEGTAILAKTIGAAIAVALSGIGAGYAVAVGGSAVASAMVERRELVGPLLLIVVLGEGIAIYGFLIALLLILLV